MVIQGPSQAFFMRAPKMDELWAPQTLAPMGSGASASKRAVPSSCCTSERRGGGGLLGPQSPDAPRGARA